MLRQSKLPLISSIILSFLLVQCGTYDGDNSQSLAEHRDDTPHATSQTVSISNPAVQRTPQDSAARSSPANATSGQPGQASSSGGTAPSGPVTPAPLEHPDPRTWQAYVDRTYHFRIAYPPYITIKHVSDAERAQLTPVPLAATYFQDGRNELAALAPPLFSIRIFANESQQPVADWLVASGLLNREAGWIAEPFTGANVSGVKVVSPTLMAPGWFLYVRHKGFVFQLTPLGEDADRMLSTFALTQ